MKRVSDRTLPEAARGAASRLVVSLIAAALITGPSGSAACANERVAQATPNVITPGAPAVEGVRPPSDPVAGVDDRIAELHEELGITPQEEPRFDAFAAVMRANAQSMATLFQRARTASPDVTAPDRLRFYAQVSAAHADGMQKLVPVFETLYQSLSGAQKKAADMAFGDLEIGRDPNGSN